MTPKDLQYVTRGTRHPGEAAFNNVLFTVFTAVDPAFTYVLNSFNRVGIKNPEVDVVCFIDDSGVPTVGVNYDRFLEYSIPAQIGVVEHTVGHFISGHVGNTLGHELRKYCTRKYGRETGNRLYYTVVDAVADAFVSVPEALVEQGRQVLDVTTLGLDKYAYTTQVCRRIEELMDQNQEGEDGDGDGSPEDALDGVTQMMAMGNATGNSADDVGDTPVTESGDIGDQQATTRSETGGASTRDLVVDGGAAKSLMAEQQTKRAVASAVAEYKRTERNAGWMSGDASSFIKSDSCAPVVPWFQEMNQAVSACLTDERQQSRKRQNRRAPDIEQWPGRVTRGTTRVCFVIDTSGSMGEEDLNKVDSQLSFCAQQTEDVYVIQSDAKVTKCEKYRRGMDVIEFTGRGGTSFKPALIYIRDEFVEEHGEWPNAVVYITDGFGDQLNDKDPIINDWDTMLLWVLTPGGMDEATFRSKITRSGRVIKVDAW